MTDYLNSRDKYRKIIKINDEEDLVPILNYYVFCIKAPEINWDFIMKKVLENFENNFNKNDSNKEHY